MVNKVHLLGNLAADPDVKATPKGTYIANLRLATNTYPGKDEAGNAKKHAEFHHLVAFGHTAEFAGQYLRKGRTLYVEGRLKTRSWANAAGQKRYRIEEVVDYLRALGKRPEEPRYK